MEHASLTEKIYRRADVIGASGDPLPTYGHTEDFGCTPKPEELHYTVFDAVTLSLSCRGAQGQWEILREHPFNDR
jgi:hypothetical protein